MNDIPSVGIEIVLPAVSDDQISNDLRYLTEVLALRGADTSGGFLGGEFGYGADFDNEVFTMFPYYWGDCECGREKLEWQWCNTNDHAEDCYQNEILRRGFIDFDTPHNLSWDEKQKHNTSVTDAVCAEMGLNPKFGSYVHCTCAHDTDYAEWNSANPHDDTCGIVRPNFLHKSSGSTVNWYKYIGRSMEVDLKARWTTIFAECIESVK